MQGDKQQMGNLLDRWSVLQASDLAVFVEKQVTLEIADVTVSSLTQHRVIGRIPVVHVRELRKALGAQCLGFEFFDLRFELLDELLSDRPAKLLKVRVVMLLGLADELSSLQEIIRDECLQGFIILRNS